jgi:hypothetical protein
MQVFVPLEDANLDARAGVLVPYRCGLACAHELRAQRQLPDGSWQVVTPLSDGSSARRPDARRASTPGPH